MIKHREFKQYAFSESVFPYRSKVAIVLGNGPSLDRYENEAFLLYNKTKAAVFGVNRVFYQDTLPIPCHYYVACDKQTWTRYTNELHELFAFRYFMPDRYRQLANVARLLFFPYSPQPFCFATKWGESMGHGHTSVFPAIQFAYMMGAKEIHVFGVDFKRDPNTGKMHSWSGDKYGHAKRTERSWALGRRGVLIAQNKLQMLGVRFEIHSDLFEMPKGVEKAVV